LQSAGGVQKGDSGRQGVAVGIAAVAFTIWKRHLVHELANPVTIHEARCCLPGRCSAIQG